jgi:hypothetical protein
MKMGRQGPLREYQQTLIDDYYDMWMHQILDPPYEAFHVVLKCSTYIPAAKRIIKKAETVIFTLNGKSIDESRARKLNARILI